MTRRTEAACAIGALIIYAALAVSNVRTSAATFDEGAHLPAGYSYWALHDYRLNPEHPPLVKLLAAAPIALTGATLHEDDVTWTSRRQWELGRRFLYHWNDADRLLLLGRLPIVGLGLGLAAAVYFWARRLYGPVAALVALGLAVLSPDVIAHGTLVTTDVGIALFSFLTVAALERLRRAASAARIAAFAVAFALAAASKFSVLLVVPALILLTALLVRRGDVRPRDAGRLAVAAAVAALVLIWACYGFRFAASPDPAQQFDWTRVQPQTRGIGALFMTARDHHLLPEAFLYGFLRFFKAQEARPAFLHGVISEEGWWYYFPATFAIKTPIPLLVLLAAAAVASARRRDEDRLREAFLWLPPVLYMALVMTSRLNIGHRHLLPIYPCLFVLAARSAVAGLGHARRAARLATMGLLAWYAAGTLHVHPHELAYFNELVGGPSQGYRWLVDSNLDWGQDLRGLKAWMDAHGVAEIHLAYFGTADPDYYGIRGQRLPGYLRPTHVAGFRAGEWVAVSATLLQGLYVEGDGARRLMKRLRQETPVEQVGYSILLYRPSFDYDPGQEPLY
jgi:hypothetical protein